MAGKLRKYLVERLSIIGRIKIVVALSTGPNGVISAVFFN
jgi:hypothetical protein